MLECLAESQGLVWYQEEARCHHQFHILVLGVHWYFCAGLFFFVMCIYSSPSSGTSKLLEFLINGLLMGKYAVSGTSVITYVHCSTSYSSVPLKFPWHGKMHHWLNLFTIWSSLRTTLIYLSASLLSLLWYASANIFAGCRYWIKTEQTAPTLFRRFEFFWRDVNM